METPLMEGRVWAGGDIPVPEVPGVSFSAVAEVHASAVEVDEDTLVVKPVNSEVRAIQILGKFLGW